MNSMGFRFEKLEVWRLAREFAGNIYESTRNFPEEEKFGLVSQLRRAAVSIAANIAEGSDRKSDAEFTRFLRIALASLEEVITELYISLDQGLIKKEDFDSLYKKANVIAAKLNSLINSLKK